MLNLMKPQKLKKGDKVATVSLSWGGAGDSDLLWRYEQGKQRLKDVFGLEVVEMPNTLKGSEYLYNHPEKRAEDLMQAFKDKSIKGIFSCIGGDESIRMLPFIDFDTIKNNPKIFIGYSDTTISNFMCLKSGLSSFYGAAILSDFAENIEMSEYTVYWLNKVLFTDEVIGKIEQSPTWTSEYLTWDIKNKDTKRHFSINNDYQLLQGKKTVQGKLIGGCIEVLEFMKGTELFPSLEAFEGSILFLETSEDTPEPALIEYWLRNYGTIGVLERIKGILFGKPQNEMYFEEYKIAITKILAEYGKTDLPVLYNLSFGHCEPKCCIPYGVMAEINCEKVSFSILESAVV